MRRRLPAPMANQASSGAPADQFLTARRRHRRAILNKLKAQPKKIEQELVNYLKNSPASEVLGASQIYSEADSIKSSTRRDRKRAQL
jgi:hypothetical protein